MGKMGILHSCILNVLPKSSACAFRRNVLEQIEITSSDYQVESELTVKALGNGNIVEEVPIKVGRRKNGHSHVNPLSDGLRIFKTIIRTGLAQ